MQNSIFITGAGSGIGRETARLFGQRGWFVGIYDLDEQALAALADELPEGATHRQRVDVTDRAQLEKAIEAFGERTGGKMDVLVNNAGVMAMEPFADMSAETMDRTIDVNCRAVVQGTRAALPLLERSPRATVMNLGSASAFYGVPDLAVYSASKFFVRGLTEALELELAPRGIRVVDVMPSYVSTPMVTKQKHQAGSVETQGVKLTPSDVANAIVRVIEKPDGRVHHILQPDVAVLGRFSTIFPSISRRIMKRFSKL